MKLKLNFLKLIKYFNKTFGHNFYFEPKDFSEQLLANIFVALDVNIKYTLK